MEKLLFALLLLIPSFCFSQTKGDNTISIPHASYSDIKSALFNNGYTLINSDTVYLATSSKQVPNSAIALKMIIFRSDSLTYIKGLIKPTVTLQLYGTSVDTDFTDLAFKGSKNSPIRKVWSEMDKIAKQVSPNVEYLNQKISYSLR